MAGLEGVKVGDRLSSYGYAKGDIIVRTVVKVTKTHAVCDDTTKWQIKSGRRAGERSGYYHRIARFVTDKDLMANRVREAEVRLAYFKVTADNVAAVEALLEAHKEPAHTEDDG